MYSDARSTYPDAIIDLVCHSQGCVVAAMAQLEGVRKTVFIAPPDDSFGQEIDEKIADMLGRKMRPGTMRLEDGSISYPRRDGSTTVISAEYWKSREGTAPVLLYKELSKLTDLTIIKAESDEVLGETDFTRLSKRVRVAELPGGHDFNDEYRATLARVVAETLLAE